MFRFGTILVWVNYKIIFGWNYPFNNWMLSLRFPLHLCQINSAMITKKYLMIVMYLKQHIFITPFISWNVVSYFLWTDCNVATYYCWLKFNHLKLWVGYIFLQATVSKFPQIFQNFPNISPNSLMICHILTLIGKLKVK